MGFVDDEEMNVIKRNGEKEIVSFDKILQRIKKNRSRSEYSHKLYCTCYESN